MSIFVRSFVHLLVWSVQTCLVSIQGTLREHLYSQESRNSAKTLGADYLFIYQQNSITLRQVCGHDTNATCILVKLR